MPIDLHSNNTLIIIHSFTSIYASSTHQQMELNPPVRTVPLSRFRCTHFRHSDSNCTDDVDSNTH